DVTVNLTGTIDRITPAITSDPPTSDITLFSLLGLGGLARSTTPGATAGQPGAQPTTSQSIYQAAAGLLGTRVFPFVDSFSYDPGLQDTDPGPKVGFQKRISSDLTTYLIFNTLDHKQKVVVEWQVNPEWVLRFTRDEMIEAYQMEARYRRRYPGRWTWGSRGTQPVSLTARYQPAALPQPPVPKNEPVAPPPGSPIVTSISFNADSKFDTAVVEKYVTQRVGQPLSMREIQSSIKALFSTGDFRDVRVDSAAGPGGVALTFSLFVNYRV